MLKDAQRRRVGGGTLIPHDNNYAQLEVYENQTRPQSLDRMHGLRHACALARYEELKCQR